MNVLSLELDFLKQLLQKFNVKIKHISIKHSEYFGNYIEVQLNEKASKTLEVWEKIIEEHKFSIPVFMLWEKVDLKPEELGFKLAEIFAKMNIHLVTEKKIDVVKLLDKEWNDK